MKAGSVIYKGFILLICIFGVGSSRGETTIDALFQAAVEQVDQVSRAESIKAFEEIVSKDRNYAPAYNELAKLHLLDYSVNGRQRAMRMTQHAIAIDPDNMEYRLTRGKIWWTQGFRSRALNQFKDVIEKDPKNTAVLNGIVCFGCIISWRRKIEEQYIIQKISRSLPGKPKEKQFRSCEKASNWMEPTSNLIICWAYSTLKINTGMPSMS